MKPFPFIEDRMTQRMKLEARLQELARLEAGWADGEGVAIDDVAIDEAGVFCLGLLDTIHELRRPRLFPNLHAGVQAEWTLGDWEVEITFSASGEICAEATCLKTSEDRTLQLFGGTTGNYTYEYKLYILARFIRNVLSSETWRPEVSG